MNSLRKSVCIASNKISCINCFFAFIAKLKIKNEIKNYSKTVCVLERTYEKKIHVTAAILAALKHK